MAEEIFFEMKGIDKDYIMGGEPVHVLKKIDLSIEEGEYLSVLGPSGSGKSTIAKLISSLWDVDDGAITIGGADIRELSVADFSIPRQPVF